MTKVKATVALNQTLKHKKDTIGYNIYSELL